MANDRKEQAKALYIQDVSISEIERRGVASRRTIQRWMKADAEAGNDWDALKNSLPQPERLSPKVVNFEKPRTESAIADTVKAIAAGDYDTLEGQLQAIDDMLEAAKSGAYSNIPQEFAAAINGFCRLLELRNKLLPVDNEELIREVAKRYRTPREAARALREAGWQDSA